MAKNIKVLVNTGNEETNKTFDVTAGSGKAGKPTLIKAVKGARYHLENPAAKNVGPENIRSKRVGKNLHVMLDGSSEADLIIEGYYDDAMLTENNRGLYGRAEDGKLYEYIPEDPTPAGMPINLADGGKPVSQVLGGGQIGEEFALSGLVVAAAGFNALTAGAAAVGAAALAGGGGGGGGTTPVAKPSGQTGALAASSDTGSSNTDGITNNKTPAITGKATAGAAVKVTLTDANGNPVSGGPYTATADSNGNYTVNVTPALADGKYKPVIEVTNSAGSSTATGTQFEIDTSTPGTGGLTHNATIDTGSNTTDSITSNKTPTFSGTGEPGATVKVTVNGVDLTATVDSAGNWTTPAYAGAALTDGQYPVQMVFTDKAGNTKTVTADPLVISTVAKTAAISVDAIAGDNTINATEASAANTTVTGKVTGDFTNGDTVTLTVNNKPFTGNVNASGVFSISIPTSDLTADTGKLIKASVVAHSTAGVPNTVSSNHTYVVDTSVPDGTTTSVIVNAIAGDDVLNSDEGNITTHPTTAITGKVTGEFKVGDVVTVSVNGHDKTGAVAADGTFSINVDTADLLADPHATATVTVAAHDSSNNVGNVSTNHVYVVDTTPPDNHTTSININPIATDNIINADEAATASIPVTGKVTGEFKTGDQVTITVHGQSYTGTVDANGNFNIPVPTVHLIADNHINITVDAHDSSNNLGSVTATHQYVVDTQGPTNTTLIIDAVTSDNVINATEASAASTTITGKVVGEFTVGDIVTLTVNGHDKTGAVAADGTYSISVSTADLTTDSLKTINGSIAAHDVNHNLATIPAQRVYVVDTAGPSNPSTILSVDPVTTDNVINITESAQTNTSVSGKVTGEFKQGDIVTLTVHGKPFTGDVNANGEFTISVTTADLTADTNKVINASIAAHDSSGNVGTVTSTHNYGVNTTEPSAVLSVDAVTADNIINAVESNSVTIAVTGKVTGTYSVNDQVTLTVAGNPYTGTVNSNGVFSINVATASLLSDANKKINASILAHDGNNNAATITAVHGYVVDTSAPDSTTTVLILDTVTADNIINADEASTATTATLPISGRVTGEFTAGDQVTLSVNGHNYTVNVAADGTFSKEVNKVDLLAVHTITATIAAHDSSNNSGNISAQRTYAVDTVVPVFPTTVLTIDPVTADNILNISELAQGTVTVTGKVEGEFKANDRVTLTINNNQFFGNVDSTGVFSIAVSASDLKDDSNKTISATIAAHDSSNNVGNVPATHAYLVDLAGPTPSTTTLVLDPVTADNALNATEAALTNTNVTGKVSGEFKAGDQVTLTINGNPFTGTVAADGTFTISVTTADLVADSDKTIQATLVAHDPSGNSGNITATQVYQVDTSGPTPATTSMVFDNVTADNVIIASEASTTNTVVSGKVSGEFKAGDIVTLKVNGNPFTGAVAADGTFSISVTTAQLIADGDSKIEATIAATDVHGNVGNVDFSHNYVVDTSGPDNTSTTLTVSAVAGDDIINLTESQATNTTVSGTVTGDYTVGDIVTLRINGTNYTTAVLAGGTFTKDIPTSALIADTGKSIAATLAAHDRYGNPGTVTAAHAYTVDTNGPSPSNTTLTISPITGDDILSLTEAGQANTTITGTVTGQFTAGNVVTLTINGNPYTGTVNASGAFSISNVLTADLVADNNRIIDASLAATNASGNPGTITATHAYSVQSANNAATVAISGITDDTGVDATDYITADNTLSYSGTVTGFTNNGDKVKLELIGADGTTVVATTTVTPTITSGTNATWVWDRTAISPVQADGKYTLKATLVDISGARVNAASTGTDSHVIIIDSDGSKNTDGNGSGTPTPDTNTTAAVTIDAISVDSGVSSSDFITSDNSLIYSGSVTGFANNGDVVKVQITPAGGNASTTVTAYATVTMTGASTGTWSLDKSVINLADGNYTVVATLSDKAGNQVGTNQATQIVTIDTSAGTNTDHSNGSSTSATDTNTAATAAIVSISTDSGYDATDFVTNDATLLVKGTVSNLVTTGVHAGDQLLVEIKDINDKVVATQYIKPDASGNWELNNQANTLADGKYTIAVHVVDLAGNRVTADVTHSLIVDTNKGGTDASSNPGNTDSSGAALVDPNAATGVSVAITGITDDTGFSASDYITADGSLTISGTTTGFTNAVGTGSAGDKVRVQIVDALGKVVAQTYVDSNGTWSFNNQANTLSDGNYTLKAAIVDKADNIVKAGTDKPLVISSTAAPTNATLAISAISDDTGTSTVDFITQDRELIIHGTVNNFDSTAHKLLVQVIDSANHVVTSEANVAVLNGTWTLNNGALTNGSLADGKYTIRAVLTSSAGVEIASTVTTHNLAIDNAGGSNPNNGSNGSNPTDANTGATLSITTIHDVAHGSVDSGSSTSDFITNDPTLLIQGSVTGFSNTGASTGDKVRVQIVDSNSVVVAQQYVTPDANGNWSLDNTANTLKDGKYTVKAVIVDAPGNTVNTEATHSLVIDTNQGGTNSGSNPGNTDSNGAAQVDPNAASGVSVLVTGITTDTGYSATDYITADGTLTISGSTTGFTNTAGTGSAGDKVRVQILNAKGDVVAETYTDPVSGTWSFNNQANTLFDGNYTIKAAIVDAAGNIVKAGADQALVIDNGNTPTNATLAISSISDDSGVSTTDFVTNDNTLTINGTTANVTVGSTDKILVQIIKVSDGTIVSTGYATHSTATSNANWTYVADASTNALSAATLADGSYTVRAVYTTATGTEISTAQTHSLVVDTAAGTNPENANGSGGSNPNGTDPNAGSTVTVSITGIDDGNTATNSTTGSKDTGVSATDLITTDQTLVISGNTANFTNANGGAGDVVRVQIVNTDSNSTAGNRTAYVNVDANGNWSLDNTAVENTLPAGTYTLKADIVDKAGNLVKAGTARTLKVQTGLDNTTNSAAVVAVTAITEDTGASSSDFISTRFVAGAWFHQFEISVTTPVTKIQNSKAQSCALSLTGFR